MFRTTYLEEHPLMNYYIMNHLILLKIKNMIFVKEALLQYFFNFFGKKSKNNPHTGKRTFSNTLSGAKN